MTDLQRAAIEQPAPAAHRSLTGELQSIAIRHVGEILAELPPTVRRVRMLLLVLTISIPLFLGALIVVLWQLAT